MAAMRIGKVECIFFGERPFEGRSTGFEMAVASRNGLGGSSRASELMTASTRPFWCAGGHLHCCIVWLLIYSLGGYISNILLMPFASFLVFLQGFELIVSVHTPWKTSCFRRGSTMLILRLPIRIV